MGLYNYKLCKHIFYLMVCKIVEKNLLFINKKIIKKNQISKYYISSSKKLIKTIYKQLIDKKSLNLVKIKEKN